MRPVTWPVSAWAIALAAATWSSTASAGAAKPLRFTGRRVFKTERCRALKWTSDLRRCRMTADVGVRTDFDLARNSDDLRLLRGA